MKVILGLGNPGEKYEKTRHNVGFRAIEEFKEKNHFPDFKLSKKLLAEISEGEISGQKVILTKPQTFMNNSGKAVKLLTKRHQFKTINLIVIHDDIDLPLGKIKISAGRGAAGHKGVESIIKELGTKDFVRFRIGIGPKPEKPSTRVKLGAGAPYRNKVSGAGFVLEKFKKDEEKILKEEVEKIVEAIEITIKEGIEKAMNKYNR